MSQESSLTQSGHSVRQALTAYMKGLGADEDGNLLSDKTKSIDLTANCVRVY
jgi:hypothetical protein